MIFTRKTEKKKTFNNKYENEKKSTIYHRPINRVYIKPYLAFFLISFLTFRLVYRVALNLLTNNWYIYYLYFYSFAIFLPILV